MDRKGIYCFIEGKSDTMKPRDIIGIVAFFSVVIFLVGFSQQDSLGMVGDTDLSVNMLLVMVTLFSLSAAAFVLKKHLDRKDKEAKLSLAYDERGFTYKNKYYTWEQVIIIVGEVGGAFSLSNIILRVFFEGEKLILSQEDGQVFESFNWFLVDKFKLDPLWQDNLILDNRDGRILYDHKKDGPVTGRKVPLSMNRVNGELKFEKITITKDLIIDEVIEAGGEVLVENAGWRSYWFRHLNGGQYAIFVYYYNNKLDHVHLGLQLPDAKPYSQEEKGPTLELLEQLGGEKEYDWGKVSFEYDPKNLSYSIGIAYAK